MVKSVMRDGPVAVIDLGSNSVLLLVLAPGGRVLHDAARVTRLGAGVFEHGRLAAAARERTRAAVKALASRARSLGAARVVAVGTEALRLASDADEFLAGLRREAHLDATWVVDGQVEAELTLEGVQLARPRGRIAVVDVGGGSTEVAWPMGRGSARALSLPLGSVRLTEAFLSTDPPSGPELAALRAAVASGLGALRSAAPRVDAVVAVAGTATTLAALELRLAVYDGARVEGLELARERLRAWIERLAALDLTARRILPGMEPGRADVIVAGLLALDGVLEALAAQRFKVSERGLRYGMALRLLAGSWPV